MTRRRPHRARRVLELTLDIANAAVIGHEAFVEACGDKATARAMLDEHPWLGDPFTDHEWCSEACADA